MRRLRAWFSRLGELFGKRRREQELSAEMESHLQLHIEDNLRSGMSQAEARREALMKLGGVEQTKENYRERRGLPLLEVFFQDLRFGARMLRKNPGFTLVAVLTLALGIAANATIFSFVSAVLYKRPPVYDPDRVMVVYGTSAAHGWGTSLNPISTPNYFTWKRENRVFSDLAALEPYTSVSLTGKDEPERVTANRATANYFSVIGVAPELGRSFAAGEDQPGHDRVVLLDYGFWVQKFGSDPNIVGKTIRVNGEEHTVIGVLPQRFQLLSFRSQVWLPLVLDESQQGAAARQTRTLYLFARSKPGVTLELAQANMKTLGSLTVQSFPETETGWDTHVLTLQQYIIHDFNANAAFVILLVGGRIRSLDCVRQHRRPSARARDKPRQGNGRAHCHRRWKSAHRAPVDDRSVAHRRAWIHSGLGACAGRYAASSSSVCRSTKPSKCSTCRSTGAFFLTLQLSPCSPPFSLGSRLPCELGQWKCSPL